MTLSLTEANSMKKKLALDGIRPSPELFLRNGGARAPLTFPPKTVAQAAMALEQVNKT